MTPLRKALAATDRWVKSLNALALKISETEQALHPSAWPEALKVERDQWKKMAKETERGK